MTKIQAITADNKPRQATTENPATLRAMRDSGLYATITNNSQQQARLPETGGQDCRKWATNYTDNFISNPLSVINRYQIPLKNPDY